jgi:hypothetical protein
LLQLGVKLALPIRGAGWAGRIGGTGVVANKNMAFKRGQAVFLLKAGCGAEAGWGNLLCLIPE